MREGKRENISILAENCTKTENGEKLKMENLWKYMHKHEKTETNELGVFI